MAKTGGLSWPKAKPRAGTLRRRAGALLGMIAVLMAAVLSLPAEAQAAWDANGITFTYDKRHFVNPITASNGNFVYCASAPRLGPDKLRYHEWQWVSDMDAGSLGCDPNALGWLVEHGYPVTTNILGYQLDQTQAYNVTQRALWMMQGSMTEGGYIKPGGHLSSGAWSTDGYVWLSVKLKNEALQHTGYNAAYTHWLKYWRYTGSDWRGRVQDYIDLPPFHPQGWIKVQKTSNAANDIGITNTSSEYTLSGAQYGIWNDGGGWVTGLTLDDNGQATTGALNPGTYWVHETAVPGAGFNLDTSSGTTWSHGAAAGYNDSGWHSVTVAPGQTATATSDETVKDMPDLAVQKLDAQTGTTPQYDGDFQSTFRIQYYGNTNGDTSGSVLRQWTVKTNAAGYAHLDSSTLEAGSDALYMYNGKAVAPAGTYKVTEITAPYLYELNETPVVKVIKPGSGTATVTISATDPVKKPGSLSFQKKVEGSSKTDMKFTFSLTLKTIKGNPYKDSIAVVQYGADGKQTSSTTVTPDANGKLTFTLKKDEKILFKDLHPGTRFSETETNVPLGYIQSDAEKTFSGEIQPGNTIAHIINNSYAAKGEIQLKATKLVKNHALEAGRWSFVATDSNGNKVATATNDASGNVVFTKINYTQADAGKTFTYTLREISAGGNGWTVDSAAKIVKVKVTDNGDGTLKCEQTSDGGKIPVWTNVYRAEGKAELQVHKLMKDGSMPSEGAYTFELDKLTSPSNTQGGTKLQTKTNSATGMVRFDAIKYDQNDAGKTYYYGIHEVKGNDTNTIYDTATVIYKVVCKDNGDGSISTQVYQLTGSEWKQASSWTENQVGSFTNEKKPGELTIKKDVEGTPDDTLFTFKVTIKGPGVTDDTVKSYLVMNGDGTQSYGKPNSASAYPYD